MCTLTMATGEDYESDQHYFVRSSTMADDHDQMIMQHIPDNQHGMLTGDARTKINLTWDLFEDLERIRSIENIETTKQVIAFLISVYYQYRGEARSQLLNGDCQMFFDNDRSQHAQMMSSEPPPMVPIKKSRITEPPPLMPFGQSSSDSSLTRQSNLSSPQLGQPFIDSSPTLDPPPLSVILRMAESQAIATHGHEMDEEGETTMTTQSRGLPRLAPIKRERVDEDSDNEEAPSHSKAHILPMLQSVCDSQLMGSQLPDIDPDMDSDHPRQENLSSDDDGGDGGNFAEDDDDDDDERVEQGLDQGREGEEEDQEGTDGDGWVDGGQRIIISSPAPSRDHRYCKEPKPHCPRRRSRPPLLLRKKKTPSPRQEDLEFTASSNATEEGDSKPETRSPKTYGLPEGWDATRSKRKLIKVVVLKPNDYNKKERIPMNEAERNARSMQRIIDLQLEFKCKVCITRSSTVMDFLQHMQETHPEFAERCVSGIIHKVEVAKRRHHRLGEELRKAGWQRRKKRTYTKEKESNAFKPAWRQIERNEKYVWHKWKLEQGYSEYQFKFLNDLRDKLIKEESEEANDDSKELRQIIMSSITESAKGDSCGDALIDPMMLNTNEVEKNRARTEGTVHGVGEMSMNEKSDPSAAGGGDNDHWKEKGHLEDQSGMISDSNMLMNPSRSTEDRSKVPISEDSDPLNLPVFVPERDEDVLVEMSGWCDIFAKCLGCSEFVIHGRLASHINKHHRNMGLSYYVCDCGQKLVTEKGYHAHIAVCNKQKRSLQKELCDQCGKEVSDVRKHRKLSHSQGGEVVVRQDVCKICGEKFMSKNALRKHEAIHQVVKSFICQVCGRGFHQQCQLKSHMRQHTNEKPYKCEHCDQAFTHKVSLKNHAKRYHGIDMWALHPSGATGRRKRKNVEAL